MLYVLRGEDSRTPAPTLDAAGWAAELAQIPLIAETELSAGARLVTLFLGLDLAARIGGGVLFHTLRVNPDQTFSALAGYTTWADAEAGHARLVKATIDAQPLLHIWVQLGLNEQSTLLAAARKLFKP